MLLLKVSFAICLVLIILGGIVMLKNFDRWFGLDAQAPSDNESAVLLNKSQAVIIWIFSIKLCALMLYIL